MVVVGYLKCDYSSAVFKILFVCLLFERTISISTNKEKVSHLNGVYVRTAGEQNTLAFEKPQLFYRRHRRKLRLETSDQLNSLDSDNSIPYQEYQGVFGRPGVDFPVLSHIPVTKFNCRSMKNSNNGYYADLETNCQVFHVCDGGRKISFLCPNGTIFRQSHLICDWWFRVDCERSPEMYEQSLQHFESDQPGYKQRAEVISKAMQNALTKGVTNTMLDAPLSITTKLNEEFNSESHLPSSNQQRQRTNSRPEEKPFLPVTFPIKQEPSSTRAYNLVTPSVTPMLPPKFSYDNSYFKTAVPFGANNNQNTYSTPSNRIKFTSNVNLNPTSPTKVQYNTLNFNKALQDATNSFNFKPIQSPRVNYYNQNFNIPQPRNENFNDIFNPMLHPKVKPNLALESDLDKQKYSGTAPVSDNFNSINPATLPNVVTVALPVRTTPRITSQPKLTLAPIAFPLTRFAKTQNSTIPLKNNFVTTTPPVRVSNSSVPLGIDYDTGLSSQTTQPAPSTYYATNEANRSIGSQGFLSFTTNAFDSTETTTPFLRNEFREQQILAETAAFAGKGKYASYQNLYFPQNLIKQYDSKEKSKSSYTSTESIDTTLSIDESYKTTLYSPSSIADSEPQNVTNNTFALYYPSGNDEALYKFITTTSPKTLIYSIQQTNFSKPAVSEFLLSSERDKSPNSETITDLPNHTIPILLTNQTQKGYNQLFSKMELSSSTTRSSNDLENENSNGLVQSSSPKTLPSTASLRDKLKQKGTPDFRELAQIFSRALSAYLEDPEQFRKVLSEVRPTEPPPLGSLKAASLSDDEILAFSEDNEQTTSRQVNATSIANSRTTAAFRDPETFAEEINNFMFAEQLLHNLADSGEFNVNDTYYPFEFFDSFNSTRDITFTVSPMIDFSLNASVTLPTAIREIAPTTTPFLASSAKNSLYNDNKGNSEGNEQSIGDEQLFITADTQSFVSSDNLLRYKNKIKYEPPPPILKTPAYPHFGIRTTGTARNTFFNSRGDFPQTTSRTRTMSSNYQTSTQTNAYSPTTFQTRFLENLSRTTMNNDLLTTLTNLVTVEIPRTVLNESTVQAMMDMMQEAKTNAALRNKLVLLLVNDKNLPENRSIQDLKSKLLRALLVPQSTYAYEGYTQPVMAGSRQTYSISFDEQNYPTTISNFLSGGYSKLDDNLIQRRARTTVQPDQVTTLKSNCSNELFDADTRAVDLLKTLYSIASNNRLNQ